MSFNVVIINVIEAARWFSIHDLYSVVSLYQVGTCEIPEGDCATCCYARPTTRSVSTLCRNESPCVGTRSPCVTFPRKWLFVCNILVLSKFCLLRDQTGILINTVSSTSSILSFCVCRGVTRSLFLLFHSKTNHAC